MTTLALNPESAIFAVEDDHDDLELLRILLRKAGVPNPVKWFRSGEAAISALSKLVKNSLNGVRPFLCFLDPKMAEQSGHEVLRWIREQAALARLPVVMLSSSEHPRDIQQAAQSGAQCYLAKYPQPTVLKQIVEDAERFVAGSPAEECFRIPENLLLVRCRRLSGKPMSPVAGIVASLAGKTVGTAVPAQPQK